MRNKCVCHLDPVGELVKEKSALHRRLEETLTKNKVEVLRLVSTNGRDPSEMVRLREQAAKVTKQLTAEIQREAKEEAKNIKQKTSEQSLSIGRIAELFDFL